jgi:hypothetical protein
MVCYIRGTSFGQLSRYERTCAFFLDGALLTAHIGNNSLHWLQSSSGDNHVQGIMTLFTICSNHQVCELCFWCMLKGLFNDKSVWTPNSRQV